MKKILALVGIPVAIFVALSIITATPLVGEVVTLHTRADDGGWQTTPLWVIELGGSSYLRAGTPKGSGWVTRLQANPQARIERAGKLLNVHLVEEPAQLSAVHAAMTEKYGWADEFVSLLSGDRSLSLPLRIQVLD